MNEKQIFLRVSADLHKSVAIAAAHAGISKTAIIINAIEKYLHKDKKKP